ncbi:hypothetical protein Zmor_008946 [Zophobas morio]|jgi:hypothetical protein|uniref:Uncharacterized protein n=1 Tax=Zophobas morio TaxID=2755281 RepID=A0AA38HIF7_9CUCU|nr:hypothetical protein Zmor_008946 [Zophobas morio]
MKEVHQEVKDAGEDRSKATLNKKRTWNILNVLINRDSSNQRKDFGVKPAGVGMLHTLDNFFHYMRKQVLKLVHLVSKEDECYTVEHKGPLPGFLLQIAEKSQRIHTAHRPLLVCPKQQEKRSKRKKSYAPEKVPRSSSNKEVSLLVRFLMQMLQSRRQISVVLKKLGAINMSCTSFFQTSKKERFSVTDAIKSTTSACAQGRTPLVNNSSI